MDPLQAAQLLEEISKPEASNNTVQYYCTVIQQSSNYPKLKDNLKIKEVKKCKAQWTSWQ
jgi:hypothetical protein